MTDDMAAFLIFSLRSQRKAGNKEELIPLPLKQPSTNDRWELEDICPSFLVP